MKRIMILFVIGLATMAWYRTRTHAPAAPMPTPAAGNAAGSDASASFRRPRPRGRPPAFRCDGRKFCSQMHSRAEAEFFLRHCPDTRMDGDHDGVPCENDSRF